MEQLAIADGDGASPTNSQRRRPARRRKASRTTSSLPPATVDPVAQVVVDVNAVTIDHTFDYKVPEALSARCLPGCRVRVRFAGRLVNGFVVSRRNTTDHEGRLSAVTKVLGPPVLLPEILELSRAVADRYAGTLNVVLRDAVPARHAATEADFTDGGALLRVPAGERPTATSTRHRGSPVSVVSGYLGGGELLASLAANRQVRASMVVAPIHSAPDVIADLVESADGPSVIVVPDGSDVERFGHALEQLFPDAVARLTGDQKPAARYRTFLELRVGRKSIVVGTRNSVFAPLADARLIVVWDDGDESLCEVRAPGWHAREVAALRSLSSNASLVVAGYSQSIEAARLVEQGWLTRVEPDRSLRRRSPRVLTATSGRADDPASFSRLPRFAWETISRGLLGGPVLVQVGRAGYLPGLACGGCRAVAKCGDCGGPLGHLHRDSEFHCRWCGHEFASHKCVDCGGTNFRAIRVGSERTAEELRAAFPDWSVMVSDSNSGVKREIGSEAQIVVATVGAEPYAAGRYQAGVLLDGDGQLSGAQFRGEEQLIRRWFSAMSLIKGSEDGGVIAVTADPHHRAVQAIVRSDAVGWAERELAERVSTGLPPVTRSLRITGGVAAVSEFVERCELEPSWRVLGPTLVEDSRSDFSGRARFGEPSSLVRVVVLAPTRDGALLAHAAKQALIATGSAPGEARVAVRMDPPTVL